MSSQAILTNFFTAAKSRQNTHPAKRRKVVADVEAIPTKSAKLVDEKCVSLTQEKLALNGAHVSPSIKASSRTTNRNRGRRRTVKARGVNTQSKIVPDGVVSVTTSLEDDHEATKPRKQCRANPPLLITKATELAAGQPELKASQTKKAPSVTQPPQETSSPTASAPKPANIHSQARTGLGIDPWISEQSKLVLASRGRQALEKSLGRTKATGNLSKTVQQKGRVVITETPKPGKSSNELVKRKVDVPRLSQGVDTSTVKPKSTSGESGSNLPAYKRFSHLLEAKKPKPSGVTRNLPLPYHFKVLEEMFRCVDVVLSLKQKRYETCTFQKLKDAVQEMCRKKFEKKHLAQMKTVYPTAFSFHQQSSSSGPKKSGYQLTIDFNFAESPKDFKFIESSVLIARQKQFKNQLVKITMDHHCEYLVTNYPSLTVDDNAIMRWHPCFALDEVPEIDLSPLPEPPQTKKYSTAQDVLDQARHNMTPRVEKALNLVAKKSTETNNVKSGVKPLANKKDLSQAKNQNPSLKGISQSLIDKIREKEERKVQESLTLDSEVVQKRIMIQRLPELCRILKTYFISERKAAIPLEDVSTKLSESYTSSLSSVEVEKHMKLLSEVVPEWVSIMYVRKCPYVKLRKNVNIGGLIEKLKSKNVN